MWRPRRLTAALLLSLAAAAGCGGLPEYPPPDELREQFAAEVPPYWRVSRFAIAGGQWTGGDTLPRYRARFTAELELTAVTYLETRRVGDAMLVRQAGTPGDRKTVFGTVESAVQDGAWKSTLRLDTDPTATFGVPREKIQAARIVVAGTDEERAFWREHEERPARAAPQTPEAAAALRRLQERLVGEWHGQVFESPDSRLVVLSGDGGLTAELHHQGYVETLRVELLAGGLILLTGTTAARADGGRVEDYALDTLEVEITPDGGRLVGSARDQGGATGEVRLRRVIA